MYAKKNNTYTVMYIDQLDAIVRNYNEAFHRGEDRHPLENTIRLKFFTSLEWALICSLSDISKTSPFFSVIRSCLEINCLREVSRSFLQCM